MDEDNKNSGVQEKSTDENMVTHEKLEGTPFVLRNTGNGYFVTMGNHKITEETKTKKEAENLIFKLNWLTLIRVIATAVDNVIEERSKKEKEIIK